MNDIYGSVDLEFEGERLTYVLSAEMDFENKNEMEVTSLGIYRKYGRNDQEIIEVWDNPTYLYYTLFINVLGPFVCREKSIPFPEHFTDVVKVQDLTLDDFKGLYKMFEKAQELGFFNKVIEEQNDKGNKDRE
jgi:hypothetical protein